MSVNEAIEVAIHRELKDVGLDRAEKLARAYGADDLRVKKAKIEAFFRVYAIVGTVRYAAQFCGLNQASVQKLIKNSPRYKRQFDLAHEEFCQYLEQTAIFRALKKSDSLLMFLLRANNPRKFSERLRLQAQQEGDDQPLTVVFGESMAEEPNFVALEEGVDA